MTFVKRLFKHSVITLSALALLYFGILGSRKMRINNNVATLQSTHFSIHYKGILDKEAQAIANTLEARYADIRAELQDPPHETITVYIHPSQTEFNNATGMPQSKANGASRGPNTIHLMYQTWFNSFFPSAMTKVAVHEFTHCVQLNILITEALKEKGHLSREDFDRSFDATFSEQYPRWFWEALSDYEAGIVNHLSVKYGMKKDMSLRAYGHSNQIYNVGYTIVEYMVSKWGKEKLPAFIRSYGDFKTVLGVTEAEFEKGWRAFVAERY